MASATANEGDDRPAKRTKYDYFEDLTILVGPSEAKFVVHKTIICSGSDFFKTACSGQWKEASERLVRLPETDCHTFGVYLGWLYTGNLDFSQTEEQKPLPVYDKNMTSDAYDKAAHQIIDAYVLGDMLQHADFCNALVDDFSDLAEGAVRVPGRLLLNPLWTKLPHNCTMRKLLVDYIATRMEIDSFLKGFDSYPVEAIKEIAKASVVDRDMPILLRTPRRRGKCFYHKHEEGKKCA